MTPTFRNSGVGEGETNMGYSKRLLDGISDEELERLFGRPEEEPWPSDQERSDDEERESDVRFD